MRITFLCLLLTGCMTMPDTKIGDGQSGCTTVNTVYGSVSTVVTRDDNAPKGSTLTGKRRITCGSAVMEIDNTITVPVSVSK